MEEKNKIKNFIRHYNNDEIKSMNFLFDKDSANTWFSQEELTFACDVDLFNKKSLENAKNNWLNINFE